MTSGRGLKQNVTYDNAKLPHALILSGRWTSNPQAMDIGLRTLRWLADVQRAPEGHFRPIGSEGFYVRGQQLAQYDQQPLEAQSMVSAAIEAYRATNDSYWLDQAQLAFEWFTGRNDLGMPVCDASSGACCDGLHADRVNQNQGAESTLAYLLALAEMQLLENSLTAFRKAAPAQAAVGSNASRSVAGLLEAGIQANVRFPGNGMEAICCRYLIAPALQRTDAWIMLQTGRLPWS